MLRPNQGCNLSEIVVRPDDTLDTLKEKAKSAAILGTLQATLTDFRYLRKVWKNNMEEEALLGVSLTGILDHPVMSGLQVENEVDVGSRTIYEVPALYSTLPIWLDEIKNVVIETNKKWAKLLGVNASAATTCVKPSGTVSQLVNSSSGIHPRFAPFYLRTVRQDVKDPLSQFLIDQGVYYEIDVTNPNNYVFYFPVEAPNECALVGVVDSLKQLELWKIYQEHWCEHKPSMTCYYTEDNYLAVGQWVWENFDRLSGVSFLPYNNHVYKQAPYIGIDEEEYEEWVRKTPHLDWDKLAEYEDGSDGSGVHDLACSAGSCEV